MNFLLDAQHPHTHTHTHTHITPPQVIKVIHNLDRNVYAVKRLRIREGNSESKLLREVSTLSRLSHPNVVRYYQAWIEDDYCQLEDSEEGEDEEEEEDEGEDDVFSSFQG